MCAWDCFRYFGLRGAAGKKACRAGTALVDESHASITAVGSAPSLPGLTRQSILSRMIDARARPGQDGGRMPMPTIAYFYGIAIRMYFIDHPPPHFFATLQWT